MFACTGQCGSQYLEQNIYVEHETLLAIGAYEFETALLVPTFELKLDAPARATALGMEGENAIEKHSVAIPGCVFVSNGNPKRGERSVVETDS